MARKCFYCLPEAISEPLPCGWLISQPQAKEAVVLRLGSPFIRPRVGTILPFFWR